MGKVLPVGAAGLAQALAMRWQKSTHTVATPVLHPENTHVRPGISGNLIILCASITEVSRKQLNCLLESLDPSPEELSYELYHLSLSPSELLQQTSWHRHQESIIQACQAGKTVIISTAHRLSVYDSTLALSQELDISPLEATHRVQATLMEMAQFIKSLQPGAFIITGGETAANFSHVFHLKQLNVLDAIEPAMPFCQAITPEAGSDVTPLYLVTKSGSFGTESSLLNIYKYLQKMRLLSALKSP
jgi:uncharacterized protein YgbK (DUF1537 family)